MTGTDCPICRERFASDGAVQDHAWDTHGACHHCGDQFDDREALYLHWLGVHEDDLSRTDHKRAEAAVGDLTFRDRLTHQGPVEAITGRISRRVLIGGGAAGLVAVIGGAVAGGIFGSGGGERGNGRSLDSHPATTALGGQPRLGPSPRDAEGTIIAFEDPSCPSCARFELGTFPKLKSRLIDEGTVSFIYRAIPVVQSWGEPAVLALEATYAREEAAFWALKEFYYRSQNQLGDGNVRARTQQFLTEETNVNGAAVLEDVDSGTHRDAVDVDLQAARDADVRGTPTFYLFKSGSYVTDIVGPQPYDVFKNSLGL